MKTLLLSIAIVFASASWGIAQNIPLNGKTLVPVEASARVERFQGKDAVRVIMDSTVKSADEPTFVKLSDVKFQDGTIEVWVYSRFLPHAPDYARGFIGIAFRINDDNSKFESFYIRPNNGRTEDQVRRNHCTQYFSYPNHKFSDFRKTDPEKYESYADMGMNEWIRMKIVVKGDHAWLYINDSKEPCLVVNDLKYGVNMNGSVGLWVGEGTEGYFADLKISKS